MLFLLGTEYLDIDSINHLKPDKFNNLGMKRDVIWDFLGVVLSFTWTDRFFIVATLSDILKIFVTQPF